MHFLIFFRILHVTFILNLSANQDIEWIASYVPDGIVVSHLTTSYLFGDFFYKCYL